MKKEELQKIYKEIFPFVILGELTFDEFLNQINNIWHEWNGTSLEKVDEKNYWGTICEIAKKKQRAFEVDWKWDAQTILEYTARMVIPVIKTSGKNTIEKFDNEVSSMKRHITGQWGKHKIDLEAELPSELIKIINQFIEEDDYPWIFIEYDTFSDSYGYLMLKRVEAEKFTLLPIFQGPIIDLKSDKATSVKITVKKKY